MKTSKFIEADQIAFEEIADSWVAVRFGEEKFVIDLDTLHDLAFRSASFLAYLESQEEEQTSCVCETAQADLKVH